MNRIVAAAALALALGGAASCAGPARNTGPGAASGAASGPPGIQLSLPTVPSIPSRPTGNPPRAEEGALAAQLRATPEGGLIQLDQATYPGRVVIDKPVTIEGRGRPVITADGQGTVVIIKAPDVTLRGLEVRNSGDGPVGSPTGIRIEGDGATVEDVVVDDTYIGISVMGAKQARLTRNIVRGRGRGEIVGEEHAVGGDETKGGEHATKLQRGDGISLWDAEGVLIRDTLVERARDGVYVSFGSDVLIDRAEVRDSRYAVHSMYARHLSIAECYFHGNLSGTVFMNGGPVLLIRSFITENRSPATGFGVLGKDAEKLKVSENVISSNSVGIQLEGTGTEPADILYNTVALNQVGAALYSTGKGIFRGNSFVENQLQVLAKGSNVAGTSIWTDRGIGNYWSDYRGYDRGGDGVGDIPHAEGGSVEIMVAKDPALAPLSSGPAFRIIRSVEDRWIGHDPVAYDELPLMSPRSPLAPGAEPDTLPMSLLGAAGGAAAAVVLVLMLRARPARRSGPGRRSARPRAQRRRGGNAGS